MNKNFEIFKSFVEFKQNCDYIANMNLKYNIINYYRNNLLLFAPNKEKEYISIIINDIKKIGYDVKYVDSYLDLYKELTNILININTQVNEYISKKTFDKLTEKMIKDMFIH